MMRAIGYKLDERKKKKKKGVTPLGGIVPLWFKIFGWFGHICDINTAVRREVQNCFLHRNPANLSANLKSALSKMRR